MIHKTSIISNNSLIEKNVKIGPYSVIYDNVIIKSGSIIGSHCEIGYSENKELKKLIIGKNSKIRSHSIIYTGSTFGDNFVTGHRVTVRENTTAGQNLQIGTLTQIEGNIIIGDYVRIHSNAHLGMYSSIGNFVWIFPYVVLTNDPHPPSDYFLGVKIKDYAVISTMSTIMPGVVIEQNSLVAAHSLVNKNVPSLKVYGGVPAKELCSINDILKKDGSEQKVYPWRRQFKRGYPESIIKKWEKEFK